jgi:hypothetical protein
MFSFLRSLHTVCYSGGTSLHSHQQPKRVPFTPELHQHLLLAVFFMTPILTEVWWNLSLICISLWLWMVTIFFMFLAIWISSIEKVLYRSVAHFFIGSLSFGEFSFLSSVYTLVITPLCDV